MKFEKFSDLTSCGEFSGTHSPLTQEETYQEYFEKPLSKYVSKDMAEKLKVYFIDHHFEAEVGDDFLVPEDLEKYVENNSLIIVNWGHHCGCMERFCEISRAYLSKLNVCTDEVYYDECDDDENEVAVYVGKVKESLAKFYHNDKDNKYIIYLMYDAIHNDNQQERQLVDDVIFNIPKLIDTELFDIKQILEEQKKNGKKGIAELKPFRSIADTAEKYLKDNKITKDAIINEMISKVDITRIINLVNAHIVGSQKYWGNNIKVRVDKKDIVYWLKKWAKMKWEFYIMFNRQFSIKTTVRYEKSDQDLSLQLNDLCNKYPKYALNIKAFETIEYKENKIMFGGNSILNDYFPSKSDMKVSKYLSQLLDDTKFDIDLSKLLQDKHMEQLLFVSIDPYDYLTSSVNKSGWRSCHNFIDGEHGVGSASYMFDNCTLVAYMCHEKEYEYNIYNYKFKGNSKNWRQLVYADTMDNRCIFSRQYPQNYNNADVSKATRELLEETMSNFCGIDNIWVLSKNSANKGQEYNFPYSMAYNDIPYQFTTMIKHKTRIGITSKPEIGEEVACPICGDAHDHNAYYCLCERCRRAESKEKCKVIADEEMKEVKKEVKKAEDFFAEPAIDVNQHLNGVRLTDIVNTMNAVAVSGVTASSYMSDALSFSRTRLSDRTEDIDPTDIFGFVNTGM